MPQKRLILFLICLLMLFNSCASTGLPITENEPTATYPPAEVNFAAPIGDAALDYTDVVAFYLPSHDGIGLTKLESEISFSLVRPAAETVMRALLAQTGNKEASSLGGEVRLALYGANPVEVSRDVVTVNLSASALQLNRESLYITCQAIANTLTSLEGINHVNVLVVDKPVGLDIANTLPMGALQSNTSHDLGAFYEQLLSRRAVIGESAASSPLSSYVTLYFPLKNQDGLICEARQISFENQQLPEMVVAILRELGAGPSDPNIASPKLPLLADLLISPPETLDNQASGGKVISLNFAHNLDDMLEAYGISRKQCTASLCYTLSSFFPNISGITLSVNGTPVNSHMLIDSTEATYERSIFVRSDFSSLIYDYCTLYFTDEATRQLVPSQRAIAYYQRTNPRVLLCELAKGPQAGDSRPELKAVMNKDGITDTTILGFALSQSTLLVNFAPSFAVLGKEMTRENDRLFAYALVNTLCMNDVVRNICFFQSGSQFDGFTEEIYWRGLFYPLTV